jgi:hypothetical protein
MSSSSFHLLREEFLSAPIHSPPLWFAQLENSPNSRNHQIESDSKKIWGQSHQPKRHKNLIRDPHQKPQEIVLKTLPTKSSENQHKREEKTTMMNNAKPSIHAMNGSYKV